MRKFALILVATIAFAASASAQSVQPTPKAKTSPAVQLPEQFKTIFDGYRGWRTAYPQISYSNSISNWALRAHELATSTVRAAARNWLFMQTEERFAALVSANSSEIKSVFGTIYLASGVHLVFSTPFTQQIDQMYRNWFACMGKTKWNIEKEYPALIEDRVHTWLDTDRPLGGWSGECKFEISQLSNQYGVAELSVDDIHAIGFLSRRHLANQKNPKFLKAEFVRKTIGDLFDPNS